MSDRPTLSWSNTPPPPLDSKPEGGIPRLALVAAGIALVAAGIGLSYLPKTAAVDEATRSALTTILEERWSASQAHDLDRFMTTVDPARVFLRDCEEQRFAAQARLGLKVQRLELGKTDRYLDYVRAWVHDRTGWQRIFFHSDGYRWYLSEPTSNELGDDESKDYSGITVRYRDVESDIADAVGHDATQIVNRVLLYAPAPPQRLFTVRVATLTGTAGKCFVLGEASGYGATTLTLRDVRLGDDLYHLSTDTSDTLVHEALHWVQFDHSPTAMNAMDWWLVEGWPFLIANRPTRAEFAEALCGSATPSYSSLRFGPAPDDPIETVAREYVTAGLLVDRLGSKYWAVVDAFAKDQDPSIAYPSALGTDGRSFYQSAVVAARGEYC